MSELHVIDVYGAGEDVVIAKDEQDAIAVLGGMSEDDRADAVFAIYDDDEPFTVRGEDGVTETTKTCAEWCAEHGRGYFVSTYA